MRGVGSSLPGGARPFGLKDRMGNPTALFLGRGESGAPGFVKGELSINLEKVERVTASVAEALDPERQRLRDSQEADREGGREEARPAPVIDWLDLVCAPRPHLN